MNHKIKYGSSELAKEFTAKLSPVAVKQEKIVTNLFLTLGIDLSDIWDVSVKLQDSLRAIAETTDADEISTILLERIQSDLDLELIWHAHQIVVKNEMIQAGEERFDESSKYLIPQEIHDEGNILGMKAYESIKRHLDVFRTHEDLKEEVSEAIITIALLSTDIEHVVSLLYKNSNDDKITMRKILSTLTDTLNTVIAEANSTLPIREELAEQLMTDEDDEESPTVNTSLPSSYDRVDMAIKCAQQIRCIPLTEDTLIQYLYTTLGADLSDMEEASAVLIRCFESIVQVQTPQEIADLFSGDIMVQLDIELAWHAHRATVKIDLLEYGSRTGEDTNHAVVPQEVEDRALHLGKSVYTNINAHLKLLNQEDRVEEYDADELINVVRLTVIIHYLIVTLYETSDPASYLSLLVTLVNTLDALLRSAKDTVCVRETIADTLFPELD